MDRLVVLICSLVSLVLLGSVSPLPADAHGSSAASPTSRRSLAPDFAFGLGAPPRRTLMLHAGPPPPLPPPPPTAREALKDGILIVVSIPSQRAFVFRRGELWDSSAVSTGKRGKETPTGEFPILQKKKHHRSTLYDDAPMPYMQRITWDGVALHAGNVPGYPASHGCIRLPKGFAERLYKITNFRSTVVVVTDERVASAKDAAKLA